MPMASATVFRFSGRRCWTPWARKPSCWRTISLATLRMVWARWSRLLTSQLAVCRQSARKALSLSLRAGLARPSRSSVWLTRTRGSVSELSSTCQPPSGAGAHEDVGHDRLHRLAAEGAARLGVERAQLGEHVGEVVVVDAAELAAARRSRAGRGGRDWSSSAAIAGSSGRARAAAAPGIRRGRARRRRPGRSPGSSSERLAATCAAGRRAARRSRRDRRGDSRPRRCSSISALADQALVGIGDGRCRAARRDGRRASSRCATKASRL